MGTEKEQSWESEGHRRGWSERAYKAEGVASWGRGADSPHTNQGPNRPWGPSPGPLCSLCPLSRRAYPCLGLSSQYLKVGAP